MSFSVYISAGRCEHCGRTDPGWDWSGMTYNLVPMFTKAGFYNAIRHKDAEPVRNFAKLVSAGLADMEAKPAEYRRLNPSNGWGDYEGALRFTRELAQACKDYPDGTLDFSG